jgi:hypothetical protein
MTAPARVTQADVERTVKAVKAAGIERARIVISLDKRQIEVIIGESGAPQSPVNPWDEE